MFSRNSIIFASILALSTILSLSSASVIGVYGGGPLYSGGNVNIKANIDDLKASGFTKVILWSVHVYGNGDLVYNDKKIASGGLYVGDIQWPIYLKDLKSGKTSVNQIYLSVGSAGVGDFKSIANLIKTQGTGPSSILYKNFRALKLALPSVEGIDLDNEDFLDHDTIVKFSVLLGQVGFKVSFCPYYGQDFWISCLKDVQAKSPGTVSHFNLQCYAGGSGNNPNTWQQAVNNSGVKIPVYPGLDNSQSPSQIQSRFSTWKNQGISGGFMWLYDDIRKSGTPTANFASAIKNGLTQYKKNDLLKLTKKKV